MRVFYKHGFHSSSLDDIQREGGISRMTLYNHFKSKDELIVAAMRRRDEIFRNSLMKYVDSKAKTPHERLAAVFDFHEDWFSGNEFCGCMFINAAAEFSVAESAPRRLAAEHKQEIVRYLRELCAAAGHADPDDTAEQLNILLEGAIVTARVVGQAVFARSVEPPPGDAPVSAGARRDSKTVQAAGWLEAEPFSVACTALADGVVESIEVLEGDPVRKGDVVARLVPEDAQLGVARAEAALSLAEAGLALAQAEQRAAQTEWDEPVERDRATEAGRAELAERQAELAQLPMLIEAERATLVRLEEELTRATESQSRGAATEFEVVVARQWVDMQRAMAESVAARRPLLSARVDRAKAQLRAAERNQTLRIEERRRLDAAIAGAARAQADVERARVARDEAALELSRMVIMAPIDGYVQARFKAPGDKVVRMMDDPTSAQLLRLYDPSRIQVRVDVPLADASHVRVGQRCDVVVEVLPDRTFAGEVLRVTHEADLQKNTLEVKVKVLDPSPLLRPEMLTRVKFLAQDRPAGSVGAGAPGSDQHVLVPLNALSDAGGATRVWTVRQRRGDRGVARPVSVDVLAESDGWAQYRKGAATIRPLDGLDLDVPEGDFLALMGPSGSGKTTLLNLIAGIDSPTGGSLIIDGTDLATLSRNRLAAWRSDNVGYVFQLYNLVPVLTAFENVELPLLLHPMSRRERAKRVLEVLERVGIADRHDHFPRQLSGGQEQRVAIARAIVTNPAIIVADEPTGDLDKPSAEGVMTLLQDLNTELNKTIIMVTHDPKTTDWAKRTLHLDKGRLVESGVTRHRVRSGLTAAGIMIAMFLYTAVQAMNQGVREATQASAGDTTLVVYREDRFCPATSELPQDYQSRIERVAGVTSAIPVKVVVSNCRTSLDVVTFRGVPKSEFLADRQGELEVISGSIDDWLSRTDAALLGETLAKRRGLSPGMRFDAAGITAYVAGVIRSDDAQDQNVAYTALEFVQLAGRDRLGIVTQFNVKVDDPSLLEPVAEEIDALFATAQAPTSTFTEKAFVGRVADDVIELVAFARWLGLGCLAAVLALVANSIVLGVQSRVGEHAVLQTIGFSGRLIAGLIIIEGVILAIVGGGIGAAAAMAIAGGGNLALSVEGTTIPIVADVRLLVAGVIVCGAIGVLAGLVPAWQASRVRLAASLLGAALVVLLVLASGGFVRGMQLTLASHAGLYENVMILGAGSEEGVERSQIDASIAGIASASVPGIKSRAGVVYASPEIHAALPVRDAADSEQSRPAVMRGVRPVALLVHPEVEITEGRPPRNGHDEMMVGSLAATRLGLPDERLAVGQSLWFDDRAWTIVGRFAAPNSVMNAEIWLPLTDLQIATNRESSLSCVIVTLDSGAFADVDLFAKSRLDLEIAAIRENDYYASIAAFYAPIRVMILITAGLIASGGLLGGLNTMYAAFAARVREIGMLQALGFTRLAIVINLSEESVFAAACGALIGLSFGLLLLDGLAVRFSMGAFAITLDAPVMLIGVLSGLVVGLVGAIPPAVRCLRLPITEALKSF
eukprot:g5639.t1